MNILIGKIGKSIKFKNLHINTGDDSSAILYSTMSRMLPEHQFYFCGPNDLSKLTDEEYSYLFPNKNVHSVFMPPRVIGNANDSNRILFSYDPTLEYMKDNDIRIDFALMFVGYIGSHTICNCCRKPDTGEYYIIMNAFKRYAGPYIHVLNKLHVPLFTIAEDPRYITINAEDFFARETLVLTQMTDRTVPIKQKYITSYEDHTRIVDTPINCTYAEVEKIFLMAVDKNWRNNIDLTRKINSHNPKCIIISNGHGGVALNQYATVKNGRFAGYGKYIVDGLKNTEYSDTHIYGKWEEPLLSECPQISDRKMIELDDEVADAKYTLVYSIIPGFVTIKPYEMIVKGLIPFIHPDYDPDRLLRLPEYLYVKDPEDMLAKMRELDADNDKYTRLANECFDCITPEYLNGSHVVNTIMHKIADTLSFNYTDHAGVDPIMDHFAKQVFDVTRK